MYKAGSSFSIVLLMLGLQGCSANKQSPTELAENYIKCQHYSSLIAAHYPAKKPAHIAIFQEPAKPTLAYRIIGNASIAKYNLFGNARSDKTMQAMLVKLAASVGGDGIIVVKHEKNTLAAEVIAYEKIIF